MPKTLYDQEFNQWPLRDTKIKLKGYNGVEIPVYGEVYLPVTYDQQEMILPLIVVNGDGPPLLGRNWLKQLKLNWSSVFLVSEIETLSGALERHKTVFIRGLETIKGFKADIKLQDSAKLLCCRAWPAPLGITPKSRRGIGSFGELIVCVPKKDGHLMETLKCLLTRFFKKSDILTYLSL